MDSTLRLSFAVVAGFMLGVIFFGGLWWTVRRGLASNQPALWFLGSMMVRSAIAVCGFYFVMQGSWLRLVACLAGFLAARLCILRVSKEAKLEFNV